MIYITGDCHGDFSKFSTKRFPEQKKLTRTDYVIITGDFGGIWDGSPAENRNLEWLSGKNFTTLFVDGNHENFDKLFSGEFPVVDFQGGKAHKISDNIYHLMRGYVFRLQGKKFFTFGGAKSQDIGDGVLDSIDFFSQKDMMHKYSKALEQGKSVRANHISWWREELPDEVEMSRGIKTLRLYGGEVDYVITHCLPTSIMQKVYGQYMNPDYLTDYFDELLKLGLSFDRWFCGHYHDEKIEDKFHILYNSIERIE